MPDIEHFPDDLDEEARRRFERGLAAQTPIPLENCLPDIHDARYLATLEELVLIALEFSWKQWKLRKSTPYPRSVEE